MFLIIIIIYNICIAPLYVVSRVGVTDPDVSSL